jgi:hypothetical protein
MDVARFPEVEGEGLDGTPFAAPRDLLGARTIALVGFGLEQRAEFESWAPALRRLSAEHPGLRARAFVAVGTGMAIMRAMVVNGIKAAVSDPETRAEVILVFTDVAAFCDALGISDRTRATLVLLESDGAVRWYGGGSHTAEAEASLVASIGANQTGARLPTRAD